MVRLLYMPGAGNTKKMAEAITAALPDGDWAMEEITIDTELKPADLYIIGFGIRRNTLPYHVLQLLDQLEDKQAAFFASGALGSVDAYRTKIESQLLSFLPESCGYRGLFLCAGGLSAEGEDYFLTQLNGNDAALRQLQVQTLNHPDTEDLSRLRDFIQEIL